MLASPTMDAGEPSRTALATVAAAHLVVDRRPWIFEDQLAAPLLGERADELVAAHHHAGPLATMRVAMATRSRYAERRLIEAARRGVVQYVLRGPAWIRSRTARRSRSGFACSRSTIPPRRRGSASAWRRRRSPWETTLGFEPTRPAFVSWLGVTQYLTDDAIRVTLRTIGDFAARRSWPWSTWCPPSCATRVARRSPSSSCRGPRHPPSRG
jgi:O-methyltransferase involved in polyketide biosynthesis